MPSVGDKFRRSFYGNGGAPYDVWEVVQIRDLPSNPLACTMKRRNEVSALFWFPYTMEKAEFKPMKRRKADPTRDPDLEAL